MIRYSQSIRRSTTLTAGILSAVLAVVPAAIYFVMAFSHMTGVIETEGEINARVVGALVVANPKMWEFEELRLKEILARRSTETGEKRVLYNLKGVVIAESSDKVLPPFLSKSFAVYDAGHQVANLVVSRSLGSTLMVTALLFCLGGGTAGFAFFRLRTVPLRAIENAYRSLKQSEEKYRSVWESLNEGLALYRAVPSGAQADLVLADINPAAASTFGFGRDDIGKSILQVQGGLFAPVREALRGGAGVASLELTQEGAGRVLTVNVFPMGEGMVATLLEDITEKKRSAEQLENLAYYDSLTGLLNRRMLLHRMEHTIGMAQREGRKMATLFFDLNGFKPINDTLGHEAGDQILIEVACRLKSGVRKKDTLARLGGDEFVVVATLDSEHSASYIAQNLLRRLAPVYEVCGREVNVGASIGISVYPDDGTSPETLLKNADIAMYNAKKLPDGEFSFYSAQMNQKLQDRMRLEFDLWMALEREEFFLEYQPIVDARSGRITAVEALVRWMSPEQGRVMPDAFIPLAEDTGIIIPLGEWVLKTACRKLRQWREAGCSPFRMSVNISGRQFVRGDLCRTVEEVVAQSGVDPALLELEFTETCLIKSVEETSTKLWHLKGLNVAIGIDDFGTGYSSLQYLKNFPIDHLKIDRAFIKNVCELPDDRAIVEAIIGIAKAMELHVIAEGVETREQMEYLVQRGCDELQGYYFHRPLSEERLLEVLREERERMAAGGGVAAAGEADVDAEGGGASLPAQPV